MIHLKDVGHSYRLGGEAVPILSNINLNIAKGDFVAIQGPSGSGKSTLLCLMGCFLRLQSGRLVIDGLDVSRFSDEELAVFRNRKLGFVFQQFHLLPRTSVLDNILLPTLYPCELARPDPAQEERARELAAFLGLSDRLQHMPNQLSGGQQQRVAIARALMNDPDIILADEPTGNLDSKSSAQIMQLFKELNRQGKTVVIITHDGEVARQCQKVFHIKDGSITNVENQGGAKDVSETLIKATAEKLPRIRWWGYLKIARMLVPLALSNLWRQKVRSALTMLGVIIGIASVVSMITLGQFTKRKILDSYAELGINTVVFSGWPNWRMKATDKVDVPFRAFDWERDLLPLKRIFPDIEAMSPMMRSGRNVQATYAGKTLDTDVRVHGVNAEALEIMQRELFIGRNFSPFHIENKTGVCVIGYEIGEVLFASTNPLGKVLYITDNENSYGCRIIGVLNSITSNKEYSKPNLQIYMPFTYFQAAIGDWWDARIRSSLLQVKDGADTERLGKAIQAFFDLKYGKSGRFRVDSDSVLIAQMTKFLNLFTIMLAAIAFISLLVGGIGITNMMLVSVSERFREIGLRKAIGATDISIRIQFLLEAVIISAIAGTIGLICGFIAYQGIIYGASKLVAKVPFEWVVDWWAMSLSFAAIFLVGVLSGFFPAVKAERLQVMDALRTE